MQFGTFGHASSIDRRRFASNNQGSLVTNFSGEIR